MASDLSTLVASLREAREGSRELDARMHAALFDAEKERSYWAWQAGRPKGTAHKPVNIYWLRFAPPVTTDLTAAVVLCERALPGFGWQVEVFPPDTVTDPDFAAHAHLCGKPFSQGAYARTVPLALCLAVLIAKEKAP